jgi:hypothetical protein
MVLKQTNQGTDMTTTYETLCAEYNAAADASDKAEQASFKAQQAYDKAERIADAAWVAYEAALETGDSLFIESRADEHQAAHDALAAARRAHLDARFAFLTAYGKSRIAFTAVNTCEV